MTVLTRRQAAALPCKDVIGCNNIGYSGDSLIMLGPVAAVYLSCVLLGG